MARPCCSRPIVLLAGALLLVGSATSGVRSSDTFLSYRQADPRDATSQCPFGSDISQDCDGQRYANALPGARETDLLGDYMYPYHPAGSTNIENSPSVYPGEQLRPPDDFKSGYDPVHDAAVYGAQSISSSERERIRQVDYRSGYDPVYDLAVYGPMYGGQDDTISPQDTADEIGRKFGCDRTDPARGQLRWTGTMLPIKRPVLLALAHTLSRVSTVLEDASHRLTQLAGDQDAQLVIRRSSNDGYRK